MVDSISTPDFKAGCEMIEFLVVYSKDHRQLTPDLLDVFIDKPIQTSVFRNPAYYSLSPGKDRLLVLFTNSLDRHVAMADAEWITYFQGLIAQSKVVNRIGDLDNINFEQDHSMFVYGAFSHKRDDFIVASVLGQYRVFCAVDENVSVFASNPYLVAQSFYADDTRSDRPPDERFLDHKKVENLLPVLRASEYPTNRSAFENVFYLPINCGVKINENNEASIFSLIDKMYSKLSRTDWNMRLKTAFEQAEKGALSMFEDLGTKKGQITGGYDSRMQLAVNLKAGNAREIRYITKGSLEHPDVKIAKLLAEAYGLNLSVSVPITDVEFDDDILAQGLNKGLSGMKMTGGQTPFYELYSLGVGTTKQYNDNPEDNYFNVGGYSEFGGWGNENLECGFRNRNPYYERNEDNRPIDTLDVIDKYYGISNIRETYTDEYANSLISLYQTGLSLSPTLYNADLPNYGLLRFRQFAAWSNYIEVLPLGYNLLLNQLNHVQPPEFHIVESMAFRLFADFMPSLLEIPFADRTFEKFNYSGHQGATMPEPIRNTTHAPNAVTFANHAKAKFLVQNNELSNDIFNVVREEFINEMLNDVSRYATKLIALFGISLFVQNREYSPL
ncbi:MAG: hypothetical protein LBS67_01390, partial [Clostridiales Family XIII bacterium]|nr:hypothetical protein [Clostridiales Family XIII bacterium]